MRYDKNSYLQISQLNLFYDHFTFSKLLIGTWQVNIKNHENYFICRKNYLETLSLQFIYCTSSYRYNSTLSPYSVRGRNYCNNTSNYRRFEWYWEWIWSVEHVFGTKRPRGDNRDTSFKPKTAVRWSSDRWKYYTYNNNDNAAYEETREETEASANDDHGGADSQARGARECCDGGAHPFVAPHETLPLPLRRRVVFLLHGNHPGELQRPVPIQGLRQRHLRSGRFRLQFQAALQRQTSLQQ